jgi:hypothetical protein
VSANLEAPDLEAWLKLQPLPFPRKKGIARNLFVVADAAIVESGCYCGEGDHRKHCWEYNLPIIILLFMKIFTKVDQTILRKLKAAD